MIVLEGLLLLALLPVLGLSIAVLFVVVPLLELVAWVPLVVRAPIAVALVYRGLRGCWR